MRAAAPFLPDRAATRRGYYVTSMDRIGLALGVGGLGGAAVTMALLIRGGERDVGTLAVAALLGGMLAMASIFVLFGPVWALLHRAHRRGPIVAALSMAVLVVLILLVLHVPLMSSGAATLILANGAIGALMQQAAYRRIL